MEKVFETKEGVALYFDTDKYTYQSDDINAVLTALNKDILNYQKDPKGAARAYNLMVIMGDMDRMTS